MAEWTFDTAVFNEGRRRMSVTEGDIISAGYVNSKPVFVVAYRWSWTGRTLHVIGRTIDGNPHSVEIPKGAAILYYRTA